MKKREKIMENIFLVTGAGPGSFRTGPVGAVCSVHALFDAQLARLRLIRRHLIWDLK